MQLNPAGREKLLDVLLDAREASTDDPEVVRKEWNVEIKRRLDGYLDGSIPTLDAGEALLAAEQRYREKYPQ